ncbi:dihydrolipoamide acetyltransferase family protein [Arthrobacter sp. NtRootA1]|uniref:dihydrolipoamide acetyltransferase family protein n=1 Tax=Arthrobacter sp. NtRootA1 TaxID=2830983 RepID=UPI001CC7C54B|nr:dihydrolipoamide acetyltransferase family protein [Arthrobacter sp. NtRootA1]BCW06240.1 dihydrolipoamide acetyltransferase component of pyruvate dehydrogenase complex [Arthrobacter sp. NtRootA1]
MTIKEFALPDVGEGLTEAEIVNWLVKRGDKVAVNQAIVEIETAKSLVELPCPFEGEVSELLVQQGETVDVGRAIISIATAAKNIKATEPSEAAIDDDPKLLVGYGAREVASRRRRGPGIRPTAPMPAPAVGSPSGNSERVAGRPKATPPVRKLAKDLGVDLGMVRATGNDGICTRADVLKAHSYRENLPATTGETPRSGTGDLRIPVRGVRKHTAAAMVQSAFTAPHVTEFVAVDITRTLELKEQIARRREFADVKLTPLTFVAKAFLHALKSTPEANATWDESAQEIVQFEKVNLGIAAATPRGLIVPNIKDAQPLPLAGLAAAISDLASTARLGKTEPQAMANGTITITNIGVFGIDAGTPILNPGEAAILAVGTARRTPWVVHDEQGERIEPRTVLQLALSFDHRIMDGQQGSQLLADTAALLREPGLALI